MDTKPMECGSMGLMMGQNNAVKILCEPLEKLKKEHTALRADMDKFSRSAEAIMQGSGGAGLEPLTDLKEQIAHFERKLLTHSGKEEKGLFSLMAKYIGREVGPIAVMEYEHEQARKHLLEFLTQSKERQSAQAKSLAELAVQAYSLLTTHFMKEENILFPMAEQMLSADEKSQLAQSI